jgi:uncharacterized SAM-binding protein YcdF (DUF218 family)
MRGWPEPWIGTTRLTRNDGPAGKNSNMYVLKQLIGALATPLMIAFMTGVAAGICRIFGRRKIAFSLWAASVAVIYFGSIPVVSNPLLGSLEHRNAPLPEGMPLPAVDYVVVLGSGYTPHDGVPVTAALDEDGLVRIAEGIRLVRRLKSAQLVVSGGAPPGHMPPALGYALFARDLGVDPSSLIVLDQALDTGAEAKAVFALLGPKSFLMVTSAYHMPRAIRLMEQQGAHPIAAPTGQRVNESASAGWRILLPTAEGLGQTDRALHEYLGLAAIAAGIR